MDKNKILLACTSIFEDQLNLSLKEAIFLSLKTLFKQAENAKSNKEEQESFTDYRQLKQHAPKLMRLIKAEIKEMPNFINDQLCASNKPVVLALVADEELAITLSLTQLDSVLEVVTHSELYVLENRLKVLFGSAKMDKSNMPFSPASICWLFSQTYDQFDLSVNVKVVVLEFLIKELNQELNACYHQINKVLIEHGILPNLSHELKPNKQQANAKKANKEKSTKPPQAPLNSKLPQEQTTSAKAQNLQSSGMNNSELLNTIFELMSSPTNRITENNTQSIEDTSAGHQVDNPLFDQMLEQISNVGSVTASSKNIVKLKEQLADQVRNETGIYYPQFPEHQMKSMDLMGMVYDEIRNDELIDEHILSSFNAINIPLLRMAVGDQDFFTDGQHPARKYMELLLNTSQKWHGTSVVKKVHQFSDSAARHFDGSSDSFAVALDKLSHFLDVTDNRATKAEGKWVSAAKGKEKLDIAKSIVNRTLNDIIRQCKVPFIKGILSHVWEDSLTLTLLREGKDSKHWEKHIKSAESLALMGNPEKSESLSGHEKIRALHQLDITMDELGFSKRDRQSAKDNIHASLNWIEEGAEKQGPKLQKILSIEEAKKNKHLNTENKKIEEIRDLNEDEKMIQENVKTLPYGCLFDFFINQQKDKNRRKLSWVSTLGNKVLFVDLMGRNPYEVMLARLAIDINRGNVVRVVLQEKTYFETVLKNIIKRLRGVGS